MGDLNKAKFCIIAVHGNVLDKIGFGIAERANRSEELRLQKTLTTINNMEQKDEHRFRKEKYNLKSQLERLKTCQIKRRRELIKKSLSEGNDLERISAGKRFNQRRLTSAAIYEHKFRFGEPVSTDWGSENVVEFTVSGDECIAQRELDKIELNENPSRGTKSSEIISMEKLPEIQGMSLSTDDQDAEVALGSNAGYSWPNNQLGTLRRQFTEPNLCSGSLRNQGYTKRQGRVRLRPSSAHTLPPLPSTAYLTQQGDNEGMIDLREGDHCQRGKKTHHSHIADEEDIAGMAKKQTCSQRYHKLLPTMKAHLKASAASTRTPHHGYVTETRNLIARRRSLDSSITIPGSQSSTCHRSEQESVVKHRLTPRSYFKKFGIPLERSELLEILLKEREILQQRIKDFLAKQNP